MGENHDHPAEEIWLDALITVLESGDVSAIAKLQQLFMPPPMIQPQKQNEWGKFDEKKQLLEKRLNLFLDWLKQEAQVKNLEFLKSMAASKERVLKQQSLVLTDYLETLDSQIENLQEEIKQLERRNAHMRSHVSPLL